MCTRSTVLAVTVLSCIQLQWAAADEVECTNAKMKEDAKQKLAAAVIESISQVSTSFQVDMLGSVNAAFEASSRDRPAALDISGSVKVTKVVTETDAFAKLIEFSCEEEKAAELEGLATAGFMPEKKGQQLKFTLDFETKCTYPENTPSSLERSSKFAGTLLLEDFIWDPSNAEEADVDVTVTEGSTRNECGYKGVASDAQLAIAKDISEKLPAILANWFKGLNGGADGSSTAEESKQKKTKQQKNAPVDRVTLLTRTAQCLSDRLVSHPMEEIGPFICKDSAVILKKIVGKKGKPSSCQGIDWEPKEERKTRKDQCALIKAAYKKGSLPTHHGTTKEVFERIMGVLKTDKAEAFRQACNFMDQYIYGTGTVTQEFDQTTNGEQVPSSADICEGLGPKKKQAKPKNAPVDRETLLMRTAECLRERLRTNPNEEIAPFICKDNAQILRKIANKNGKPSPCQGIDWEPPIERRTRKDQCTVIMKKFKKGTTKRVFETIMGSLKADTEESFQQAHDFMDQYIYGSGTIKPADSTNTEKTSQDKHEQESTSSTETLTADQKKAAEVNKELETELGGKEKPSMLKRLFNYAKSFTPWGKKKDTNEEGGKKDGKIKGFLKKVPILKNFI